MLTLERTLRKLINALRSLKLQEKSYQRLVIKPLLDKTLKIESGLDILNSIRQKEQKELLKKLNKLMLNQLARNNEDVFLLYSLITKQFINIV